MKIINLTAAAVLAFTAQGAFRAQAAISIETVTVGDINNVADPTTGYGSVGYSYNIGKYEVTIGQYTAFLNSVAKTDTYSLYNTGMETALNVAGISRSGGNGTYTYSVLTNAGQDMANRPITYVSWFDAARFSNWMANGQPTGAQGNATTENGAYTLNGAMTGTNFVKNLVNPITQGEVKWWIPSENEWYKAAYYDPTKGGSNYWLYPTQSDSAPGNAIGDGANQANFYNHDTMSTSTGTAPYITNGGAYSGSGSHYGTFDQGGNVWEWNDTVISVSNRGSRGGHWNYSSDPLQSSYRDSRYPGSEVADVGFRIASIPEPSAAVLMLLGGAGWLVWKRRKIAF